MALRLRILTGVVLFMLSICAFAQSETNPQPVEAAEIPAESADINDLDNEDFLEEVIVTGTRIARRDFNTPSPLTTINSDVIAFAVQPTLEDTLNQMPQVFPSFGRASNNPGNGTATVDLRGFGTGRSLVLLNSRRVAPSGTGNTVDLNNIPRLLIQRVEIITGGTSTVYGSDAIAGVVNFITKSDYTGFGLEAGFSITEKGDAGMETSPSMQTGWSVSLYLPTPGKAPVLRTLMTGRAISSRPAARERLQDALIFHWRISVMAWFR